MVGAPCVLPYLDRFARFVLEYAKMPLHTAPLFALYGLWASAALLPADEAPSQHPLVPPAASGWPAPTPLPALVHQTTQLNHSCVPHTTEGFDAGLSVRVTDDSENLAFLSANFNPRVVRAYARMLDGAHRAELWRYAILSVKGGIYADISTVPRLPLRRIFGLDDVKPADKFTWFVTITSGPAERMGAHSPRVHSGLMASPPGNPLLRELVEACAAHAPPASETEYLDRLTGALLAVLGVRRLSAGTHEAANFRLVALEERCARPVAPRRVCHARPLLFLEATPLLFAGRAPGALTARSPCSPTQREARAPTRRATRPTGRARRSMAASTGSASSSPARAIATTPPRVDGPAARPRRTRAARVAA
jgi:hypothetical protein